jgi:HemK-like putative methylase
MTREEKWILDEKYGGQETEGFFADCVRLQGSEPLAYIIGSIPFLNTTISLDSHPLIPRPETEYWVEKAIAQIATENRGQTSTIEVLDLCAGSGCIGVAVAKAVPSVHVDFIEIDEVHRATIEKNCKDNGITNDRYTIRTGDLFTAEPPIIKKYNYILTNPPYIDSEAETVAESVTTHEPHIALFGGVQGLKLIIHIIEDAKNHLTSQGVLYIEHEPAQAELIKAQGENAGFSVVTHTDQYGVLRYSVLTMS